MKYKILVAEDDQDIAEFIKLYLENEGYEVIHALDGLLAYEETKKQKIDLAVVDIMLPKMNGYDLIKKIREDSNIPIVILSAKNLDSDKILGLDLGADDYLTKPFNPLELIARIKSNIRRYYSLGSQAGAAGDKETSVITVGDLTLDEESVTLKKGDKVITITPTEYKMMALFMKSPSDSDREAGIRSPHGNRFPSPGCSLSQESDFFHPPSHMFFSEISLMCYIPESRLIRIPCSFHFVPYNRYTAAYRSHPVFQNIPLFPKVFPDSISRIRRLLRVPVFR